MVSDSELVDRLREFLRTSDLNTTTTAIVRRRLEEDFGVDLSDKKGFIREQVDLFLQSQFEKAEEEDGDDEVNEEAAENADSRQKIKSEENSGSDSEEEDEEDGEEEVRCGRGNKKGVSKKLNKDVKKRGGGGFAKLCSLSPQLQNFVGVPELARTEVVKQLWAYIRENNLQDPKNRRNIICDETLRTLFRVDVIDMFQMNKALSKHIWPLNTEDGPVKSTQKEKQRKHEREEGPVKSTQKEKRQKHEKEEGSVEPKRKEKRQKGGSSGFLAPLQLSDALVKFIGTGESLLTRANVVKRMWDYIKQNNLQDPSDKRRIICDEKLKELFDVDSFHGFTVAKLLAAHFIKTEQ